MAYGASPVMRSRTDAEHLYLDIDDGDDWDKLPLDDHLADNCIIQLKSCSTGEGNDDEINVVNSIGMHSRRARVCGPKRSTNSFIQLDPNGLYANHGFWGGYCEAYTPNFPNANGSALRLPVG
jgi:hypothetical protein